MKKKRKRKRKKKRNRKRKKNKNGRYTIVSKLSSVSSVVRITLMSISLFPVVSIHCGVFTLWRYNNASFSGRLLISFISASLISSLNVGCTYVLSWVIP